MITYKYRAISNDGAPVRGIIEAYDEYEAVSKIKETCRIITGIAPVKEKSGILTKEVGGQKIKLQALSMMCSQMSVILKAGVPAARCMELIEEQTEDKKLKKILKGVAQDVAAGHSMADSFMNTDKTGKAFPPTFIETIRAGEQAGTVDRAFESLAAYYEKQYKNRQKMSAALTYPIFVGVIAVIVVIIVMVKVIPTMIGVFADLGGNLPLPTRMLIAMSNFFQKYVLVMAAVALLIGVLFMAWVRTEKGRLRWNAIKLRMPVLGKIRRYNGASQFAHTMHTMLSSGLPLPQALNVTAKTMDNYLLARRTMEMSGELEEGRHLGDCMREKNCYPRTLNEMCAIGEETGELEETLRIIAEYFDNQAEHATQKAISKMEPTLLIVMAVVAGFIVFSIYLPMFSMYDLM